MSLRTRLILNNTWFAVVTAVIAVVGLLSLQTVGGNLTSMYQQNYPGISLLLNIDRDLQQALVAERSILTATGLEEIEDLDAARLENLGQAEDRFNQYKALHSATASSKRLSRMKLPGPTGGSSATRL